MKLIGYMVVVVVMMMMMISPIILKAVNETMTLPVTSLYTRTLILGAHPLE